MEELNSLLKRFKIDAEFLSEDEIGNYKYYELRIIPPSKVSDIKRVLTEIALCLKLSNPHLQVFEDRGTVRIEFFLPNRDALDFWSEDIEKPKPGYAKISLNLGKSPEGSQEIIDLSACPHILVSGTTGSGKSTVLHTIIANLLANAAKTNLHLIDTKLIELTPYTAISKTFASTYEQAVKTIDYLIQLMEYRYRASGQHEVDVLIIDECADLFFQDENKSLYKKLLKLVQKCRAANIYVIMATQRPSSKMIDGDIKANFPVKIACKAASKIDSRVVLGVSGAEALLGKGDALLSDGSSLKRFQSYYTSARENLLNI
jgi:S-DNA-T family DNA segregation ATPase FtsK/SpoIIIE